MKTINKVLLAIVSVGMFIGAFVPTLVIFIKRGPLTGPIMLISALFYAWLVLFPWLIGYHRKILFSYLVILIGTPLLLLTIELCTFPGKWFLQLGLPASVSASSMIGLILLAWKYLKTHYCLSATFLGLSLTGFMESYLVWNYLGNDPILPTRLLVSEILLGISIIFLILGAIIHRTGWQRNHRLRQV